MIGIYKITSPTDKIYIGQSWNIVKRWKQHKKGSQNLRVRRSITKHGVDAHLFEVAHELPIDVSPDILNTYEQFYMDQYRQCGFELLNLKEAGKTGRMTDDVKRQMSISGKGKVLSEITRRRISEARIGIKFSDSHLAKMRIVRIGTKHTEEAKRKISEGNKGKKKKWPESAVQWKSKKVLDTKTGIVYPTITKAAFQIGMKGSTLEAMLRGQSRNKTNYIYDLK